jgi:hypothetical protein
LYSTSSFSQVIPQLNTVVNAIVARPDRTRNTIPSREYGECSPAAGCNLLVGRTCQTRRILRQYHLNAHDADGASEKILSTHFMI